MIYYYPPKGNKYNHIKYVTNHVLWSTPLGGATAVFESGPVGSTLDNGAIGTVRAIFCVASSEGLEGVIEGGILADVTGKSVTPEIKITTIRVETYMVVVVNKKSKFHPSPLTKKCDHNE